MPFFEPALISQASLGNLTTWNTGTEEKNVFCNEGFSQRKILKKLGLVKMPYIQSIVLAIVLASKNAKIYH